jgi:protein ImuB
MQRVAALYLPMWPLDRLRRAERNATPPPELASADVGPIHAAMAEEHARGCSVPRGGGWRPGARWARQDRQAAIDALPAHQRPPVRELGRSDVAAEHAFKRLRPDEGGSAKAPMMRPCGGAGEDETPLVTALRTDNRMVIAAASPAAQALGARVGMPLAQARAQIAGLDIRPADPEGDLADLRRLAEALVRRWSPGVAIEGADTLFLDLTGVAHLHGGEARMAARLVRFLARLGVTARIGIADTPGAAWALAHFDAHMRNVREVSLSNPSQHPAKIAPLPIEALRLDAAVVEQLHRLGVERIEQLLAMPRAPLVRRFGTALAMRLEQALGRLPEPWVPVVAPDVVAVSQRFAEPIATPEAIAHWLGQLVTRLAAALAEAGQGARLVELIADRVDGVPQRIRIGLARPSRDHQHLLRLLTRRIEAVEPGYGIDAMTLHLRRAERLDPEALGERLDEDPTPDLAPLIDTLATRIGMRRLWRMRPVESDVPERSLARAPVLDPPARAAPALKPDDVRRLDRSAIVTPWHPDWQRPARLLRRPEQIDHVVAELPDHPPRRFTWRGRMHRVVRADGPERIFGEWWRRGAEEQSVRDYFHVEDQQGRRYWLFRRGDGERPVTGDMRWYLHGVFG